MTSLVHRRPDPLVTVAAVSAGLPVIVAVVRGLRRGWLPIGDNGYFAVRAADVFTRHHPLVGTWTSASTTAGVDVNNPGPLFFDLLAIPARVAPVAGIAVGVALINLVAIAGAMVFAWRRSGRVGAVAVGTSMTVLAWSLGSELLYDPWQPNALLFTFFFFLVLAWAAAGGDLPAVPWLLGVGSVLVQTHFSYAVLVASVAGVGITGAALAVRRTGSIASVRRIVIVSAVVVAACWLQPLIDQFSANGFGNLSTLVTHAGADVPKIGSVIGTRRVASVLAVPPFLARPSVRVAFGAFGHSMPSLAISVIGLSSLSALLVGALIWTSRTRVRDASAAVVLALVLVVAGLVTTVLIPVSPLGVAPHHLRWLWPVAAFILFALSLVGVTTTDAIARRAVPMIAAVGLVFAAAALPYYNAMSGPSADADVIETARRLDAGLTRLEGRGPVILDVRGIRLFDPYNASVMAGLQRHGIEFRVEDSGMIRQLGRSRAVAGSERLRLIQRNRSDALTTPPGAELVARVVGLDAAEQREMGDLRSVVVAEVTERGIELNERGRNAAAVGRLREFGPPTEVRTEALPFVDGDDFVSIVTNDWSDLDPATAATYRRYATLLRRWQRHTVAIFVEPT